MKKLDRRVRRTRRLLHAALHELILEKGYEGITVQDITDKADLSRATFYLHYKDKDELLVQSLQDMFDKLIEPLSKRTPTGLFSEEENTASKLAFQHVQEHADLYRVLLEERSVSSVIYRTMAYLAEQAEKSIMEGLENADLPNTEVPIIAHHIAGSLFALMLWWLENDMPHSPDYMADQFRQLALPGVASMMKTQQGIPDTQQ